MPKKKTVRRTVAPAPQVGTNPQLLDPEEIKRKAWLTGAFWDVTEGEDGLGVSVDDLAGLSIEHKLVKRAFRAWSLADANYDTLVSLNHGRAPDFDGEFGPAVASLASLQRCACPDRVPPDGVSFDGLSDDEQRLLENYRAAFATGGTGSWPRPGCVPGSQDVHSIRVNLQTARIPSRVRGYLDEALLEVRKAYADIGLRVIYIFNKPKGTGEIYKEFISIPGGVIGWNEFPSPGTCRQTIDGRLDTAYTPDMIMWASLECHETGHGVRLQHTRGGIMNPSILRVVPLRWRNDPSFSTLRRYFGGQPIPLDPDGPPPDDDDDDDKPSPDTSFIWDVKDLATGKKLFLFGVPQ